MQRWAIIHATGTSVWYSEENKHFVVEHEQDMESCHSEFDAAIGRAIELISANHGLIALQAWSITPNQYSGDDTATLIIRD